MNRLLLSIPVVTLLLSGCGEKDAEYYYNHPDELKTSLDSCMLKVENIAKKNGLDENSNLTKLANSKIENDKDLAKIDNSITAAIKELNELKNDKTCQQAIIAKIAIDKNNLKAAQLNYSEEWKNSIQKSTAILEKGRSLLEKRYKLEKSYSSLDWTELNKKYKESPCRKHSEDCNNVEDNVLTNYWEKARETALNKRIDELKNMSFEEVNQLPEPESCQIGFTQIDRTNLDCEAITKAANIKMAEKLSDYKNTLLTGDVVKNYTSLKEELDTKNEEHCGFGKSSKLCPFYINAKREVRNALQDYLSSHKDKLTEEYNKCYHALQAESSSQKKYHIQFETICRDIKDIASEIIDSNDIKKRLKVIEFSEPLK